MDERCETIVHLMERLFHRKKGNAIKRWIKESFAGSFHGFEMGGKKKKKKKKNAGEQGMILDAAPENGAQLKLDGRGEKVSFFAGVSSRGRAEASRMVIFLQHPEWDGIIDMTRRAVRKCRRTSEPIGYITRARGSARARKEL